MPNLEDYLVQIHLGLKRKGYPDMDNATLVEVANRLQHPGVMSALQSGQLTTDWLVDQAVKGMERSGQRPPSDMTPFVEGGLINDASGQATEQMRRQKFLLPPGGP